MKSKFYAVKIGRKPGVYKQWSDCLKAVHGHKGAVFKMFTNEAEAQEFTQTALPPQVTQPDKPLRLHAPQTTAAYTVYFDGGSRGNGTKHSVAGCGALVKDNHTGRTVAHAYEYLGACTNNQAEYKGMLLGLRMCREAVGTDAHVHCAGDSNLVIQQMLGAYQVKSAGLQTTHAAVKQECGKFKKVTFSHIYRDANHEADALANRAMDAKNSEYVKTHA